MDILEAVIFDWGVTLTRWHDVDFHAESLALAQVVVNSEHEHDVVAGRLQLHAARESSWGRSRGAAAEEFRRVLACGLSQSHGIRTTACLSELNARLTWSLRRSRPLGVVGMKCLARSCPGSLARPATSSRTSEELRDVARRSIFGYGC